jgi:hypothetical protein
MQECRKAAADKKWRNSIFSRLLIHIFVLYY